MNLTALQDSPILQSLGWAIANSLWQAAVLWIVYLLVIGVYKNASAKFKNNFSTILLGSAFLWFCITLLSKYFTIEDQPGTYEIQYYAEREFTSAATWNGIVNKISGVLPYLSIAYLLLLLFLSFRLINIYRYTHFIKFNGLHKPSVEWKLFTEKVARHMGIAKNIRLWVSHHVDVPATIGFIKPVILIPIASINKLSPEQLEAIILHELSHIKRNDYLINLFISIIETILFFNPFIVLLAKIIKRERENCCDDFVIQYQYDRHAYASALLSLEQFRNMDLKLAIGATSGKKQLLLRIKRIMEVNSNNNFNYGQKLAALLLITGVICSVAWLSPNKETKKQVVNKIVLDKIPYRKVNLNEKPETLFVKIESNTNETANKAKNTVAKLQPKKIVTAPARQLKEFRELSQKEIAEREFKLTYHLLQESKKEVVRKKIRINPNRFLMARSATFTPALFDNDATFFNAANVEMAQQKVFSTFELQKLQAELEKVHFSFSFDCPGQIQTSIKELINTRHLKTENVRPALKDVKIDIRNKTEIKTQDENKIRRRNSVSTPEVFIASNGGSYYYADSTAAAEVKKLNERVREHQLNGYTTDGHPLAYTYSFETNNEDKAKKNLTKVNGSGTGTHEKQAPPSTPGLPGSYYRTAPTVNPSGTTILKPGTTGKETIRVEYKNGVIVINGKKIELADTQGMIAVYSVKGKKILSKVKNLAEPHIDD